MKHLTILAASAMTLGGCATVDNPPLIFGQSQTVGITVAGSPASQGGEFTLGYRDWNIAVVPVTQVTSKTTDKTETSALFATNTDGNKSAEDAFSTIGQFEVNSEAKASSVDVGLGKFFATGVAAQKLSEGFAKKLEK